MSAAGEGGVAPFAAQARAGEHEGTIDRHALRDVAGDRVAVLDSRPIRPATQEPRVQLDLPVSEIDAEPAADRVDPGDDALVAVADTEVRVAAAEDHVVSGGVADAADAKFVGAETARGAHALAGGGVDRPRRRDPRPARGSTAPSSWVGWSSVQRRGVLALRGTPRSKPRRGLVGRRSTSVTGSMHVPASGRRARRRSARAESGRPPIRHLRLRTRRGQRPTLRAHTTRRRRG